MTALEAQISQQQAVLDQADEEYNQSQVNLTATQTSLHSTTASIDAAKARLATERAHLRDDAVQAYMNDSSSSALSSLFASPSSAVQTRDLYQQLGSSKVADDVASMQAGQKQLTAVQTKLLAEQQAETAQLAQVNSARQSAEAVSAQSEATLAQVKGNLAVQITQQAAAQAVDGGPDRGLRHHAGRRPGRGRPGRPGRPGGHHVRRRQRSRHQRHRRGQPGHRRRRRPGGRGHHRGQQRHRPGRRAGRRARGHEVPGRPLRLGRGQQRRSRLLGADHAGLAAGRGEHGPLGRRPVRRHSPTCPSTPSSPGTCIFYDLDGSGIDHVVMYVGPYLDGQATPYGSGTIIQAAHTGTVVTFDPIWYQGIVGAARP